MTTISNTEWSMHTKQTVIIVCPMYRTAKIKLYTSLFVVAKWVLIIVIVHFYKNEQDWLNFGPKQWSLTRDSIQMSFLVTNENPDEVTWATFTIISSYFIHFRHLYSTVNKPYLFKLLYNNKGILLNDINEMIVITTRCNKYLNYYTRFKLIRIKMHHVHNCNCT